MPAGPDRISGSGEEQDCHFGPQKYRELNQTMTSATSALRILLADDHEVVRRGLRQLLRAQSSWEVVDEATTGREAVEKSEQLKPDVVILDIAMPVLNGLEATRLIHASLPRTEILILTMNDSEQLMRSVL